MVTPICSQTKQTFVHSVITSLGQTPFNQDSTHQSYPLQKDKLFLSLDCIFFRPAVPFTIWSLLFVRLLSQFMDTVLLMKRKTQSSRLPPIPSSISHMQQFFFPALHSHWKLFMHSRKKQRATILHFPTHLCAPMGLHKRTWTFPQMPIP